MISQIRTPPSTKSRQLLELAAVIFPLQTTGADRFHETRSAALVCHRRACQAIKRYSYQLCKIEVETDKEWNDKTDDS